MEDEEASWPPAPSNQAQPPAAAPRLFDKLKDPGNIIIVLGVASVFVYIILGYFFGGWAIVGKVAGGVYYLGDGKGGYYTPVSRIIFVYSLWHFYSLIGMLILLLFVQPKRRNKILD